VTRVKNLGAVVVQPSSAVYFADCECCHSRKVTPAQGNELLCEVNQDFIRDEFNLYGLSLQVPFYARAISIIIGEDSESAAPAASAAAAPDQDDAAQSSAEILYGSIHARFIMTSIGLTKMAAKYRRIDFGRCARVRARGSRSCLQGRATSRRKGQSRFSAAGARSSIVQTAR
jgi:hypothetical protein